MIKRIICAVSAILIIISASPAVYADQKSTVINKEIIYVDGYKDDAYGSSEHIIADQIIKQNGDSTTTASIYFLYDNDFIYVYGNVRDKTRISTPPTYDWITDSVEIQLDLDCNPAGQSVGSGYTGLFRVVRYSGNVSVAEGSTSPFFIAIKDKIQCAVFDRGDEGYDFEIAIPHLNSFKDAKMGASVIVNDAADNVSNLSAMIFMNSTHTGSYNNTKQFYTFTLNNFSNARGENAPTYITSAAVSSDTSSTESEESSEGENLSGYDTDPTKLPQNTSNEGDQNPVIFFTVVGIAALIILVITVLISSNKNNGKGAENKSDGKMGNAETKDVNNEK